jgi:hypothetical protein
MRRRSSRKVKPLFYLIVDGESEQAYFKEFQRQFREQLAITLKPEIPKRKSFRDLKREFKEKGGAAKVFWIVDRDVIIKEGRVEELNNLKRSYQNENRWILINDPCLEFWFLLHFIGNYQQSKECEKVIEELKRRWIAQQNRNFPKSKVERAEKIAQEYKNNPAFLRTAIENSKRLECEREREPQNCSELWILFEEIVGKFL